MLEIRWEPATKEALSAYHDVNALRQSAIGQTPLRMLAHARAVAPFAESGRVGLAVRRLIDQALHELTTQQPQAAGLLRLRYEFDRTGAELAKAYARTYLDGPPLPISTLHDHINRAVAALADILERYEAEAADDVTARQRALIMALPAPTYGQFVGYEPYLAQIQAALNQSGWPGSPLFITGLGGIGKTSLAREALEQWFRGGGTPVEQAAWASVVQQQTPLGLHVHTQRFALDQVLAELGRQLDAPVDALPDNEKRLQVLRQRTAQQASLIVIDNVETASEAEMALRIVDALGATAKIAITSRYRVLLPQGQLVSLSEMSAGDAIQLLKLEAERLRFSVDDAELFREIYQTVGGNPHALKLIIAQLVHLPKERVLGALFGQSLTMAALFDHIYETAWSLLSAQAQDALLGLWLLPSTGANWRMLQAVLAAAGDAYPDTDLESVLRELVALNLIQVTPALSPLYLLHRLTYRFIESKLGMTSEGEG